VLVKDVLVHVDASAGCRNRIATGSISPTLWPGSSAPVSSVVLFCRRTDRCSRGEATTLGWGGMDHTVAELNIEHFRKLLAVETDETKREMVLRLLAGRGQAQGAARRTSITVSRVERPAVDSSLGPIGDQTARRFIAGFLELWTLKHDGGDFAQRARRAPVELPDKAASFLRARSDAIDPAPADKHLATTAGA
jgi:hypothetical protein